MNILQQVIFIERKYADIELEINGHIYNLHKWILIKESEFFRKLFEFEEKNFPKNNQINLLGINNKPLDTRLINVLLKAIYFGSWHNNDIVSIIDLLSLYKAVDFLIIPRLLESLRLIIIKYFNKNLPCTSFPLIKVIESEKIQVGALDTIVSINNKDSFKEILEILLPFIDKKYIKMNVNFLFDQYVDSNISNKEMVSMIMDVTKETQIEICHQMENIFNLMSNKDFRLLSCEDLIYFNGIKDIPMFPLRLVLDVSNLIENNSLVNEHFKTFEQFCLNNNMKSILFDVVISAYSYINKKR